MTVSWLKFCFHMKEERFYLRRSFRGGGWLMCWTTHASLYKHSRPSPNNLCVLKWPSEKLPKEPRYLAQTTESSSFPAASLRHVTRCSANSVRMMLTGNVYIRTKTAYGSEAHVKNKEKRRADGKGLWKQNSDELKQKKTEFRKKMKWISSAPSNSQTPAECL